MVRKEHREKLFEEHHVTYINSEKKLSKRLFQLVLILEPQNGKKQFLICLVQLY